MIPLNKDLLAQKILETQNVFIETKLKIDVAWPYFIENHEKDLKTAKWDKKKELEKSLGVTKANIKKQKEDLVYLEKKYNYLLSLSNEEDKT